MSVWHGDHRKKKPTGGRRRSLRTKRKFEEGTFPTEPTIGELKKKVARGRGGNLKIKILNDRQANVTDQKMGKTQKAEIARVVKSPANIDYDRRGVITRGSVIETSIGIARVTSRPGQHGIINAVLVTEEKKS